MTFHYTRADRDVDSSVVHEAYYDRNSRKLAVVLSSGEGYVYNNVPEYTYHELVDADSPGAYYNRVIKRTYGPATALGYVDSDDFTHQYPAPDMSNVVSPVRLSGAVTPKNLTYAPNATVTSTTSGSYYVTLANAPERNTTARFAVTFEVGGKSRTHTLDAESFGAAEAAVVEIASMLDLTFDVKEIKKV